MPFDPSTLPVVPGQTLPPLTTSPYRPEEALKDLPGTRYALSLFLNSHMVECEDWCNANDKKRERLYWSSGIGLIECVRGVMSFEDADLNAALASTKHAQTIAQAHRKKTSYLTKLTSFIPSTAAQTAHWLEGMTSVERHAELVYAETTFEKALLGVLYSGDWFAFVREALALRSSVSIYRSLYRYMAAADEAAGGKDRAIDEDFRSGVLLGTGMTSLILSLLPSRVLSIVELFGYKGDRHHALSILMQAGGWKEGKSEPEVSIAAEGIRRPLCDVALLIFHLAMSSLTSQGVNLPMARIILEWNLKRYPKGVYYLFGSGRIALASSLPAKARVEYRRAMEVQDQYRTLHYISYWEMAMASISLWDMEECVQNWKPLKEEATWSRAVYAYGYAVTLLQLAYAEEKLKKDVDGGKTVKVVNVVIGESEKGKGYLEQAQEVLATVPGLSQRIAGKSIPVEKFVSRKARRLNAFPPGRLPLLPLLEFGYFFQTIAHMPLEVLWGTVMPLIDEAKELVCGSKEGPLKDMKDLLKEYYNMDDYLMVKFLEGVVWRYIAYPDPDADPSARVLPPTMTSFPPPTAEASSKSKACFELVIEGAKFLEQDFHLLYHALYEQARVIANLGDEKEARRLLDLVLSGKPLEGSNVRKGKYSMENTLAMRATAAVEALDGGGGV